MIMRPAHGFSLVELLVAIVIGLLAVLAATKAMVDFEGGKRNSISGSDSMQNGFIAVFALETDGSKAGWGLNNSWLNGCPTLMYDAMLDGSVGYPLGGSGAQILAPAVINDGKNADTGSTSDTISFYTGNSPTATGSVIVKPIDGDFPKGDGKDIPVAVPIPVFNRGDLYVVAPNRSGSESKAAPGPTEAPFCLVGQVTDLSCPAGCPTTSSDNNSYIQHGGTVIGIGSPSRFNKSGGLAPDVSYDGSTRIYNLGPAEASLNSGIPAIFHRWFIQDGNLMVRASDVQSSGKIVDSVAVANVVSLKAQYGIRSPGKGIVWSSAMTDSDGDGTVGSMQDWQNVVSVRIAIVARSTAVDKPDPTTGECTATQTKPKVFDGNNTGISVNVAVTGDSADWKCYRYRVFETIIPLRNAVWTPPPPTQPTS